MRPALNAVLPVLLAGAVAAGFPADAGAGEKYYRWVDENGQVHVGSRPEPGDGEEARELELRAPGRGEPGPAAGTASPEPGQEEAGGEEPVTAGEAARREQNCLIARRQIASYSTGRRVRYRNEQGEYEYLTEETRATWLEDSRRAEKEYCN